jgi:hypothetical protein
VVVGRLWLWTASRGREQVGNREWRSCHGRGFAQRLRRHAPLCRARHQPATSTSQLRHHCPAPTSHRPAPTSQGRKELPGGATASAAAAVGKCGIGESAQADLDDRATAGLTIRLPGTPCSPFCEERSRSSNVGGWPGRAGPNAGPGMPECWAPTRRSSPASSGPPKGAERSFPHSSAPEWRLPLCVSSKPGGVCCTRK